MYTIIFKEKKKQNKKKKQNNAHTHKTTVFSL